SVRECGERQDRRRGLGRLPAPGQVQWPVGHRECALGAEAEAQPAMRDFMRLASYRSPKTVVRPSRIVGRGLFAEAPIAEGEIVCVKGGHLLTKAEFANCKGVANEAELQIADDLFLSPVSEGEFEDVMMFLNHSCEPNVGIQGQIVFVAMRAIAAGEELTL